MALEVICGPMFSGKTTQLCRIVARARASSCPVQVFVPVRDTRTRQDTLTTHDGLLLSARSLPDVSMILLAVEPATKLVVIDEGHLWGDTLPAVVRCLLRQDLDVVVGGLDLDWRREPFHIMTALLAMASRVERRVAQCTECGEPAEFSQRLTTQTERIVIGGADVYAPRCAECFQTDR